jgi:hypothetical protein
MRDGVNVGFIRPKGKTHVCTEPGEALSTRPFLGHMIGPSGQAMQIRRAFGNVAAATTDDPFIDANPLAAIRIVGAFIQGGDTGTDVTIKSKQGSDASVAISPLLALGNNGALVLPLNPQGWFQTSDVNQAVVITTGAGTATGITFLYIEIPADALNLL